MSLFIVLVGFVGSGKTTLAKRLEKDLSINVVSGDPLRNILKNDVLYFKDLDISFPSEKGNVAGNIIRKYRKDVCRTLLKLNQSVIYDSNALTSEHRRLIIDDCAENQKSIIKVIIYVSIKEKVLIERLNQRPEKSWIKLYLERKKPIFEEPSPSESDYFFIYNQDNYQEIKNALAKLNS